MHCKPFILPLGALVGLVLVSELGQDVNAIDLLPRYKHQQLARSDVVNNAGADSDKKQNKKHKKGKDKPKDKSKPKPQPGDATNAGVCYNDNTICTAGNGDIIHPGDAFNCKSVHVNTDTAMVCDNCNPTDPKSQCHQEPHGNCLEPLADGGTVQGCFVQF